MGLLRFLFRVAMWPVRIALFFLGVVLCAATLGTFIDQGVALTPLALLLATGACFEGRRALA